MGHNSWTKDKPDSESLQLPKQAVAQGRPELIYEGCCSVTMVGAKVVSRAALACPALSSRSAVAALLR